VGKEERGAFGGVARAWDCLFGEAERLNCCLAVIVVVEVMYSNTGKMGSVLEM
jgi:hypothetical protein